MATKIYEAIKSINRIGAGSTQFNTEIRNAVNCVTHMPVIAKGNVYQGVLAQW